MKIISKSYIIQNLDCAHCASRIEKKINELPEVSEATIIFASKKLNVSAENPDALLDKLQAICSSIESEAVIVPFVDTPASRKNGSDVEPSRPGGVPKDAGNFFSVLEKETKKDFLLTIVCAAFFVIGFLLEHFSVLFPAGSIVLILVYLVLGLSVLKKAGKSIINGNFFNENFLMSLATIAAICLGDFAEAAGVMMFFRIGELFEEIAVSRSRERIMSAVDLRPETVNLTDDDGCIDVIPASDARVNDIILVRPGDRIPLDGTVIEGSGRIDTSAVTGEPVPVSVGPGSEVLSGCLNENGMLRLRVDKPLSESMVSKILHSVENAAAGKPKIDRFITKFAGIYTPVVIAAALLTAIIPSLVTGEWSKWIYTAVTFLVISCPCALVLSVPLAFFSGIGAGSKLGILFKSGLSLEALKNTRNVVLDKTGTITKGNFKVQEILSEGIFPAEKLLELTASAESASTHPIAQSILREAQERGAVITKPESAEEISGMGISAHIGPHSVLCGNSGLMKRSGIELSGFDTSLSGTEVLVAVDGQFAGCIRIDDEIKSESGPAVKELREMGKNVVMLTGDTEKNAKNVAASVGINEYHSSLLPNEKLSMLQRIREKNGSVMFVGDGINDAPVLAFADVGAAMGSGADAAIEAADVVFMNSSLNSVTAAVRIAKKTGTIAMENVVFAILVKVLTMVLGLLGFANMWLAVFADTGVAIICILNSIRAMRVK